MPVEEAIAKVERLVVRFGDFTAVDGLSFEIMKGETLGFLGPNGAGKTTTIRTMATIQRPTSGRVAIGGHDTRDEFLEARKMIGISQQHIALDKELTIRQNIKQHALLHKIPKGEIPSRIEEASETMGLGEFLDRKVESLSGGWKRKASIVCAIVHRPEILFLDEPTAGLDAGSRHLLWDLVHGLRRNGTTILLTTHYIEEAESLCDRVAIIDHGRLVALGTPEELRDSIGKVTVQYESDERIATRHFPSRDEAKAFSESLDSYFDIRRTTLEDVFLELTGGRLG